MSYSARRQEEQMAARSLFAVGLALGLVLSASADRSATAVEPVKQARPKVPVSRMLSSRRPPTTRPARPRSPTGRRVPAWHEGDTAPGGGQLRPREIGGRHPGLRRSRCDQAHRPRSKNGDDSEAAMRCQPSSKETTSSPPISTPGSRTRPRGTSSSRPTASPPPWR